jgi:(2R)-3-sulfolactate dehydrogenase (NADP+)
MGTRLTLVEIEALATAVLRSSGASELQAGATARSIRDAEADGIRNVGLGYLPVYADHVACGKVRGDAVPTVELARAAVVRVDAHNGFAHPAFMAGFDPLVNAARTCGVATMSISHSYSAGVVGWFVELVAEQGLIALMFANSSAVMAPWGGRRPFFGTNPIAYAIPRADGAPLVADMSSAAVAWVTLRDHADAGKPIPATWALDTSGRPTTDAVAGLAGTVAPAGGHKGSALALLVDLLAGGLTGSSFSHEASSFGDNNGGPVDVGQLIVAFDPSATAGTDFVARVETDLAAMTEEGAVRLPGAARTAHRALAEADGVEVPDDLMALVNQYAASGSPAKPQQC